MNNYNEYGYDEGLVTLTIPEEGRLKWREWKKETRQWRKDIEEHIDEKHSETQAHVTSEATRVITAVNTARDYVITQVNNNTNTKTDNIRADITSLSNGILTNIWNKVRNL